MTVALVRKEFTEGPWALPEGWCWSLLSDVAFVNPATSFDHLAASDSVTFVPMAAVAEETGTIDLSVERPMKEVAKGYVRFAEGDVIFAKITPCMENGKIAPVPTLRQGVAAGSTEFHVLRPLAVEQRYLWYWLVGRTFRGRAQRNMSGSAGQLRVPVTYLRESEVPVPPLAEQRRIVARVDALFDEIVEGERALDAARKGLETYRRALLKAAVSGELTADWRDRNAPAETGAALVERIRLGRSLKPKRSGRSRVTQPAPVAASQVPEGWGWTNLAELFDIATGTTPSRRNPRLWGGGIPWVSSGEVAFCRIRTTRETISPEGLGKSASRLHPPGTVLLAMIGEGKTRGQCAILDVAATNNQNSAAIRVSATDIPPEFIFHVLEERYFRSRKESQGGNQAALNGRKVGEMGLAMPSLAEVHEILARLRANLDAASDTQHVLDAEASDVQRLRQSVLKAAFEGRLVPQDESDEPAAVMLARIAASQAETPRPRRGRPRAVTP